MMVLYYLKELLYSSPITVGSTFLLLFLGILYAIIKDKGLPPGPIGLPFLGYWPFLRDGDVHLHLADMTKKYGDVFSINVFGKIIIHLGSIKAIKEAHMTKADCFTERYTDYSFLYFVFEKGVDRANGEKWVALRKFFLHAFREYGLISLKEHMAAPVYDSVNTFLEKVRATNGQSVNIVPFLNIGSADIMRCMLFNDKEITDEELIGALESYKKVMSSFIGKQFLLAGEFARYFVFPTLKGYKETLSNHKIVREYLTKLVQRHEKTYDEDVIRDVVDRFIKERNDKIKKGDPSARFFTEEALVYSLVQFIGDGILSVAIFIAFFIYGVLKYPEEQEKIYREMEDVIGPDRPVTLEDRNKLPYTNAFIHETTRTTDFLPIFPSLVCTKETTLNGYRIPKGAITLMNFWSSQRDPNVFENPDEFNPSRYISEPNKPKAEKTVIFGIGKRSCFGESYTMMQVFLFFTNIIKNFRLEGPTGDAEKYILNGEMVVRAYPRK